MAKQLLHARSLRRRLLAIVTLDHLQEQSVWNKLAPLLEAANAFLSLMLDIIAIVYLRQYLQERVLESLPQSYTGFEPQISVLVPAYNEETTIAGSIRSLLQLSYSEYEIVVVNDGSKDATIDVLRKEFDLFPFPEAYNTQLPTAPIRAIYHSSLHANLRVIDKENGGKADSLNAGINLSVYPLFCCIDADSILQPDSLRRAVQPFLDDHRTVASGGTVRIANGCRVENGFLTNIGLPSNLLALFQIVEYLRAFRPSGLVAHERHVDHLRRVRHLPQRGRGHRGRIPVGYDR